MIYACDLVYLGTCASWLFSTGLDIGYRAFDCLAGIDESTFKHFLGAYYYLLLRLSMIAVPIYTWAGMDVPATLNTKMGMQSQPQSLPYCRTHKFQSCQDINDSRYDITIVCYLEHSWIGGV